MPHANTKKAHTSLLTLLKLSMALCISTPHPQLCQHHADVVLHVDVATVLMVVDTVSLRRAQRPAETFSQASADLGDNLDEVSFMFKVKGKKQHALLGYSTVRRVRLLDGSAHSTPSSN